MLDRKPWPLLLALLLCLSLVVSGCSDDDDDDGPTGPAGNNPPAFEVGATIELPSGLQESSDPQAQMAYGFVSQLNDLVNYVAVFTPPQGAKAADDGPPWVYTWTYSEGGDSATVTLTIDESGGYYTWELRWDGTVEGEVFDDVLVYAARQAVDGSSGDFYLYDLVEGTGQVVAEWHWSVDAAQTVSFEMISWDGSDSVRITAEVMADGSGSLDLYEGSASAWVQVWHFEWDALGAGSWAQYEDGSMVGSGTWSV